MTDDQILALLLEKGGLPAVVLIGLGWLWWKFPGGRIAKETHIDGAEKVAARVEVALAGITSEIRAIREEGHARHYSNGERFATLEAEVRNLKERMR